MEILATAQPLDFVDEACVEHRIEALCDPFVQYRAIRRFERDRHEAVSRSRIVRATRCGEQHRHRLPAQHEHFERTLDPLRIVRCEPRGRVGVDLREPRVQRGPAIALGFGIERRAHVRIGARQVIEPLRQRLVVQHRAAREQRRAAARGDLADQAQRVRAETRGRIRIGRIDDVDQVMRHARALVARRLRGADIHVAVDERRIDADDLDRATRGERQRRGRLARCGGAEQAGDRRRAGGGVRYRAHCPRMKRRSRSFSVS